MNRELQEYYENRFAMMATQGWRDLVEDIELMVSSTDRLSGVDTENQLYFKKGELSIMNWIRTLRESSTEVYEQLQEDVDNA
jgi:high-affinity K+ transport system ATPase subunit B